MSDLLRRASDGAEIHGFRLQSFDFCCYIQISAERRGCLLSYSQSEPVLRELTQQPPPFSRALYCTQGWARKWAPHLVHFIPAVAFHFFRNLSEKFSQPGAHFLAQPCTKLSFSSQKQRLTFPLELLPGRHQATASRHEPGQQLLPVQSLLILRGRRQIASLLQVTLGVVEKSISPRLSNLMSLSTVVHKIVLKKLRRTRAGPGRAGKHQQ